MLKRIGAIGGAFLIVAAAGTALAKPSQNGRRTTGQGRQAIAPSVVGQSGETETTYASSNWTNAQWRRRLLY